MNPPIEKTRPQADLPLLSWEEFPTKIWETRSMPGSAGFGKGRVLECFGSWVPGPGFRQAASQRGRCKVCHVEDKGMRSWAKAKNSIAGRTAERIDKIVWQIRPIQNSYWPFKADDEVLRRKNVLMIRQAYRATKAIRITSN